MIIQDITIEQMLSRIDFTQLRIIAGGTYNVVLTDGTFVIKIGTQVKAEITKQQRLADYGIGIPVYCAERAVAVDQRLLDLIMNSAIYNCGVKVSHNRYIYKKNNVYHADIAIYALAESFVTHTRSITLEESEQALSIVNQLKAQAEKYRIFWQDAHIYNIGLYNGRAVILDV